MNFKIGIDGGGTKTEFILTDAAGVIIDRRLDRGCNPSLLLPEEVDRIIRGNLQALLESSREQYPEVVVTHTLMGMAGSPLFWRDFAAKLDGFGAVQTQDDSIAVLELATGGAPGLVLHAGTGSFIAARGVDGAAYFAGGLGWRFGDPGSAYDLGRRVVARAILELQGWAEPSRLGRTIATAAGCNDAATLTRRFYADTSANTALADFAPHVTAAAEEEDLVAVNLITQSVTELAHLARSVIQRLFAQAEKLPVGLSGAILQTAAARTALVQTLGHHCILQPITDPPIEGLRRLLARL